MGYIRLNRDNFFNNLDVIAKKAGAIENIALVLKDNAYGHGLKLMAKMSSEFGVRHVVVRSLEEAKIVEKLFESVLVLSDTPVEKCSSSIYFTINSLSDIEKIYSGSSVELKVNTGMNRNGINEDELEIALERISEKKLVLKGLFTHHSSADSDNDIFDKQNARFARIKEKVLSLTSQKVRFHSANSAALFRAGLSDDEDIIRVGIAAYGCLENEHLKPVLSLVASKIATRELSGGDSVGYDATYMAKSNEVVSTYDIGYADGFSRLNENFVTVEGFRLIGRISMDNISIASQDDEVVLFDDAREYAKVCGTISYEVLVRMKDYLERKVV